MSVSLKRRTAIITSTLAAPFDMQTQRTVPNAEASVDIIDNCPRRVTSGPYGDVSSVSMTRSEMTKK